MARVASERVTPDRRAAHTTPQSSDTGAAASDAEAPTPPTVPAALARVTSAVIHGGAGAPGAMGPRVAVLADFHIRQVPSPPSGLVPPGVERTVAAVAGLAPDAVVIAGDLTSGDRDARFRDASIRAWWYAVEGVLSPFRERAIPVLITPGNHDTYRPEQRAGVAWAWQRWYAPRLETVIVDEPNGEPLGAPFLYAADIDGLHFLMVDASDRDISAEELGWIREHLAALSEDTVRVAVGHLPLRSVMGSPLANYALTRELGPALAEGDITAWFCGHEHLLWDSTIEIASDGRPVTAHRVRDDGSEPRNTIRQVVCGVAGAGYQYAPRPSLRAEYCNHARSRCRWPSGSHMLDVDPTTGELVHAESFVMVERCGDALRVTPYRVVGETAIAYPRSQAGAAQARDRLGSEPP